MPTGAAAGRVKTFATEPLLELARPQGRAPSSRNRRSSMSSSSRAHPRGFLALRRPGSSRRPLSPQEPLEIRRSARARPASSGNGQSPSVVSPINGRNASKRSSSSRTRDGTTDSGQLVQLVLAVCGRLRRSEPPAESPPVSARAPSCASSSSSCAKSSFAMTPPWPCASASGWCSSSSRSRPGGRGS